MATNGSRSFDLREWSDSLLREATYGIVRRTLATVGRALADRFVSHPNIDLLATQFVI